MSLEMSLEIKNCVLSCYVMSNFLYGNAFWNIQRDICKRKKNSTRFFFVLFFISRHNFNIHNKFKNINTPQLFEWCTWISVLTKFCSLYARKWVLVVHANLPVMLNRISYLVRGLFFSMPVSRIKREIIKKKCPPFLSSKNPNRFWQREDIESHESLGLKSSGKTKNTHVNRMKSIFTTVLLIEEFCTNIYGPD